MKGDDCENDEYARWYWAQMKDFFNCPRTRLFFSLSGHKIVLKHEGIKTKIVLASKICTSEHFIYKAISMG